MARLEVGDIVMHFKKDLGGSSDPNKYMYKILHIAYDQNETKQVVYQALYGPEFRVWIRGYDEFMSELTAEDRRKYPRATQKYRFTRVVPAVR